MPDCFENLQRIVGKNVIISKVAPVITHVEKLRVQGINEISVLFMAKEFSTYLQEIIGQKITNISLYEQAFRHRSVADGSNYGKIDSYERLEFLGDAVLDLIVSEIIYEQFDDKSEGFLTKLRAGLVRGETLARFTKKLKMDHWLQVGDRVQDSNIRTSNSVLADIFEALVGAVYQDLGYKITHDFVKNVMNECIRFEDIIKSMDNYKSMLLEYTQAEALPLPVYRVISEYGPGHDKTFEVQVIIDGNSAGKGVGKSKKKAEQDAAKEALKKYAN